MDSAAEGEGDGEEEEERGKVCSEDDLVVARCVSVRWTHRITLSTGGGRGEGGWWKMVEGSTDRSSHASELINEQEQPSLTNVPSF